MGDYPVRSQATGVLSTPGGKTESEVILAAGIERGLARNPGAIAPGAPMHYAVVPAGATLQPLVDLYPDKPRRILETVVFNRADDFARYFANYRRPGSVIFFDEDQHRFTAVLDYHERKDGALPAADWCDHTATYVAEFSPEWQKWVGSDKKPFSQAAFAEFVEDNLPDIVELAGADLLEMTRTFEAKTSLLRMNNGSVKLYYDEVVRGTANTQAGNVEVPEQFMLTMKVFRGGSFYKFPARLKYRLKDRALVIWYEIIRPHKIIEQALDEAVALIEEKTGVSVFRGAIAK